MWSNICSGLQIHCSRPIKILKYLKYPSVGCHFWSGEAFLIFLKSWLQGGFTLNIKNNRSSLWLSLGSIWCVKIKRFSAVKHICRIMSTEVASSVNVLYLPLYTHFFLESEWSWFEVWPCQFWLHALGNLVLIYCTCDCLWKALPNTWTRVWWRVAENEGRSCIIHQARDYIMQDRVRCPLHVPKAMEIISVNKIR